MVINLVAHLKIPLINPGRNYRLILDLYTGDRFSILCKRLLEKGYPMTEIYKICGLGNYNNLFRAFKREFGITPGEYVRQFQERQKTKSEVH